MRLMLLGQARTRVTKRRIKTPQGPREILRDRKTGITLSIPIGKTPGNVVEDVFSAEKFCDKRTIRIIDVPSREAPGKFVRQMFCCLKGKTLARAQNGRTCRRGFFLQTFFIHPRKLAEQLRKDFLAGRLQARRRSIFERIREAGL